LLINTSFIRSPQLRNRASFYTGSSSEHLASGSTMTIPP
jgi:hypothetical protein